jgi:uncharacterized integral membrane protein (TIGR00698 family)
MGSMEEENHSQGEGARRPGIVSRCLSPIPGAVLCVAVTLVSLGAQALEERAFEHPYVEALVIAILLGMAIRTLWQPSDVWKPGIALSAKQLLEFAVMLLGASISVGDIVPSGIGLLGVVAGTVLIILAASFGLSRLLGLPVKLSILIACGNSICGNSAIATVAPVIGADSDDIASSISFTAILGVLMVLGLPLLIPLLKLSASQYGILAGLTVYAVPQVLAATVPAGIVSTQIGTLVKLMRVLMLGPIVIGFSLVAARRRKLAEKSVTVSPLKLVPWFIIGFLLLAMLRSLHLVPDAALAPVARLAGILTVVSIAALGLGVDVRVLSTVGGRATAAVTLSLLLLLGLSIYIIQFFR